MHDGKTMIFCLKLSLKYCSFVPKNGPRNKNDKVKKAKCIPSVTLYDFLLSYKTFLRLNFNVKSYPGSLV